jgi:hypothetical protein
MKKRICSKCGVEKILELDFYKNLERRETRCSTCSKEIKNSKKKEARIFVYNYFRRHPCVDCGETEVATLQFDHVRDKKHDKVSRLVNTGQTIDKIKAEIDKCEVVCANCHARRTARQYNWYASLDIKEKSNIIQYPFLELVP